MKKVLIITYYWPPSGGAGVQRWVKLSKYLAGLGVQVHILTVDENYASYIQRDYSLLDDISVNIHVHKTKSFEPVNIYGKLAGKKNIPTAGFSNVDNSSLKQKIINAFRSNFFIPDPRRGWNKYALRKAEEIIKKEKINTVITSSPPHSTQLIGIKLKKKFNLKWISDLRDPWTDIYYYNILNHSFISKRIDAYYEKKVLQTADIIFTVSKSLKSLFLLKKFDLDDNKIIVIPNGYDEADFKGVVKEKNPNEFIITYTGTMSDQYKPQIFFKALSKAIKQYSLSGIQLRIIGKISQSILKQIQDEGLSDFLQYINIVPHNEIIKYQMNSDILLLVIPDMPGAKGIVTGKLFEYLATGNPILCIGPEDGDAATIIRKCHAGKTFNRKSEEDIKKYIYTIYKDAKKREKSNIPHRNILQYNRRKQAEKILKFID